MNFGVSIVVVLSEFFGRDENVRVISYMAVAKNLL